MTTWIDQFLKKPSGQLFCWVPESYISDDFNLQGLRPQVPLYNYALNCLLGYDIDKRIWRRRKIEILKSTEILYGLIHARYILTTAGLYAMAEKYHHVDFGRCPRVYCKGSPTLPVGDSDTFDVDSVKFYCSCCQDIYHKDAYMHIDGAFFGTTFPHLLLNELPVLKSSVPPDRYIPRIYGFKIHPSSDTPINRLSGID